MALYDRKTDRVNKTRARVARSRAAAAAAAVPSTGRNAGAGDAFAMRSALDDVEMEPNGDEEEEPGSSTPRFEHGSVAAEQVAECEDEIDRLKRRHDLELAGVQTEVRKALPLLVASTAVCLRLRARTRNESPGWRCA
jgi:hypothetical protein